MNNGPVAKGLDPNGSKLFLKVAVISKPIALNEPKKRLNNGVEDSLPPR